MQRETAVAAFRYGYGLPLPEGAPIRAEGMARLLAGPDRILDRWPGLGLDEVLPVQDASSAARREARKSDADRLAYRDWLRKVTDQMLQAAKLRMARALDNPDQLRERLVGFWMDHFTTVGRFLVDRGLPGALAEDAIRPHVGGRFADMLRAAVLHPAMLIYLDQTRSVGPGSPEGLRSGGGLNENLARELLELHTLGVGAKYTQADVRELAELLTGVTFSGGKGQIFRPDLAEPGAETVLGKTYDGAGMAPVLRVLDDLARHPATARHIAGKLAAHFVADQPPADLVKTMAETFRNTGGDLQATVAAMLHHPAGMGGPLAKVRQPFDFLVASLRALGVTGADVVALGDGKFRKMLWKPLAVMGQDLEAGPPGPDGWPEERAAWINPAGLAGRVEWAMTMPQKLCDVLPEPAIVVRQALGPFACDALLWAADKAESRAEGLGLVLASAEFNRR